MYSQENHSGNKSSYFGGGVDSLEKCSACPHTPLSTPPSTPLSAGKVDPVELLLGNVWYWVDDTGNKSGLVEYSLPSPKWEPCERTALENKTGWASHMNINFGKIQS